MASRKVGWYTDPADDNVEIYWDGARWHGERSKLTESAPKRSQPSSNVQPQPKPKPTPQTKPKAAQQDGPPSSPNVSLPDRWAAFWRSIDDARKALIILFAIGGVALVGIIIAMKPWESEFQDDCEAAALAEGFNPAIPEEWDPVVNMCVKYAEESGHI